MNEANGAVWAESPGFRIKVPADRSERLHFFDLKTELAI